MYTFTKVIYELVLIILLLNEYLNIEFIKFILQHWIFHLDLLFFIHFYTDTDVIFYMSFMIHIVEFHPLKLKKNYITMILLRETPCPLSLPTPHRLGLRSSPQPPPSLFKIYKKPTSVLINNNFLFALCKTNER